MQHGPWGLLLLLACHQAYVALALGITTYVLDGGGALTVPGGTVWPIVFALGSLGAFDIYRSRYRSRVDLAQGLMLMAYGSRAMAVTVAGITNGWSVTNFVAIGSWVALFLVTQRAWTEARGAL